MVVEARGRISRRKDGKYFLYLPKHLAEDSAFPFMTKGSVSVRVVIDLQRKKLLVMPLTRRQGR